MAKSQSEIIRNGTTTLQKLILNTPNELFILSIIAQDGTVFTPAFILDATKKNPINFTPNSPPKLKEAYAIFFRLIERGMVKQGFNKKNEYRTIITFRGHIYRITGHYTFGIWTFVLGILIGWALQGINCNQSNSKSNSSTPISKKADSIPIPGLDKKASSLSDTSKVRTDTTRIDTASSKILVKPAQLK